MMKIKTISRRAFFYKTLHISAFSAGTAFGLAGCGNKREEACNDLSQLTENDKINRLNMGYVTKSPIPGSICGNCQLWIKPVTDDECGKCQLFRGPVPEEGFCSYWAPLESDE